MKFILVVRNLVFGMAFITLSACSTVNSSVGGFFNMDTDLEIKFKVDADVNPDDDRKPSPLFVRMYQLKSTKMFGRANFIDLYEKDKEVLGADMISVHKLRRIKPGESRDENFVLNKDTRFIGLYAEFLRYKKSGYKLLIPVVPTNVVGTSEKVLIAGNRLIYLGDSELRNNSPMSKEDMEKAAGDVSAAAEKGSKLKGLF